MHRKNHHINNKGKQGFTDVSLLFTIAVIAVFIIAIAAAAKMALDWKERSDFALELNTMSTSIKNKFAGQGNYAGLSNTVVIKGDLAPKKWIAGSNLVTPWGGNVSVLPANSNSQFTITLSDIPEKACTALGESESFAWQSIRINSSEIEEGQAAADAIAACSESSRIEVMVGR